LKLPPSTHPSSTPISEAKKKKSKKSKKPQPRLSIKIKRIHSCLDQFDTKRLSFSQPAMVNTMLISPLLVSEEEEKMKPKRRADVV